MLFELLSQREAIDAQITEIRKEVRNDVLMQVRGLIVLHDIQPDEIASVFAKRPAMRAAARKVEPKYRDPVTGKVWSGRGIAPKWFDKSRPQDFAL